MFTVPFRPQLSRVLRHPLGTCNVEEEQDDGRYIQHDMAEGGGVVGKGEQEG